MRIIKFSLVLLMLFTFPIPAFSGSDRFLGDTAIYTGDPTDTGPNILFIVDNSQSTTGRAAGSPYISPIDDPSKEYDGSDAADPKQIWSIYLGDNQGDFDSVAVADTLIKTDAGGNPVTPYLDTLSGFSGCPDVVMNDLLNKGTYSADGSSDKPLLKPQQNKCVTGPQGAVYALGNYLNYTQTTPEAAHVSLDGKVYRLIKDMPAEGYSSLEPGTASGADYWEPVPDWYLDLPAAWNSSNRYVFGTDSLTQLEMFYNALEQVVDKTYHMARFGAMVYGFNNKGGELIHHIADLDDNTTDATDVAGGGSNERPDAVDIFLRKLPGSPHGDAADLLSSPTQRLQSESLYDAGSYLGASWEGLSETVKIPDAVKQGCNTHVIILTNGVSNTENNAHVMESTIGNSDQSVGTIEYDGDSFPEVADESNYGDGIHYLDDIAHKLWNIYEIQTHTVLAFTQKDSLVVRAAVNGNGEFKNVFSYNELVGELLDLVLSVVADEETSFVAPVVPASTTNRTMSSDRVYLGLFRPMAGKPWMGNLKKYQINDENQLAGIDGSPATYTDENQSNFGDFISTSRSYWGTHDAGSGEYIVQLPIPDPILSADRHDDSRTLAEGDGGIVVAGGVGGTMVSKLLSGNERNIYTFFAGNTHDLADSANHFKLTNAKLTADYLQVTSETERQHLINYIRGTYDLHDHDEDGVLNETRPWVLGDILHSKPVVFHYQDYASGKENSCYSPSNTDGNRSYIFVGANDGMMHAIRDCDGSEAWGFIPENLHEKLRYLANDTHAYYVDSSPTLYVHDHNDNSTIDASTDKVVMLFGQRRGGGSNRLLDEKRGSYCALDVSDPEAPELMWCVDNTATGFEEMGETWSQPRLAKVKVGSETKVLAFMGAGYDNNEDFRYGNVEGFPSVDDNSDLNLDAVVGSGNGASTTGGSQHNPKGRGIFAVDMATLKLVDGKLVPKFTNVTGTTDSGEKVWSYTYDATDVKKSKLTHSFPTDLTVLDQDADGYADTIYAGDTGGRLWRFDISGSDTSQWEGEIIFSANPPSGSDTGRKIFFKPSVLWAKTWVQEGSNTVHKTKPVIYFGSGDRSHPLNTAVADRIYCVFDKGQTSNTGIDETYLEDVTANELQDDDTVDVDSILASLEDVSNYGWYISLENPGEKMLAPPVVFNQVALFTTYEPTNLDNPDPCDPNHLGIARVYGVNAETGEAIMNWDKDNDSETPGNERALNDDGEVLRKDDRIKVIGKGIPSGIVTLIDASGQVDLMISSSNRVTTYSALDTRLIQPVYWMQWK